MTIKVAGTKEELIKCFPVVKELRTHLDMETYLSLAQAMSVERYQLIYVEEAGNAVAALGYRYNSTLYDGVMIYIDDLVTAEASRGKGYGGMLFDHVVEIAKKDGIKAIHLDSNHTRFDAHRLYLNKKMKIIAHHFRMAV